MAETWTEYGMQFPDGVVIAFGRTAPRNPLGWAIVVGRQVIASDWLPVDQGGAS